MATTGARRRSQKYPDELRERAVRMVLEIYDQGGDRHGVISRVARELGVGVELLRNWVNQAAIDSGRRPGTSSADAQRIAELERENRELRRANDMAGSGGGRNDLCVGLWWCHVAEGLAWTVVEAALDALEIGRGVSRQVGALV
jgi:transposase